MAGVSSSEWVEFERKEPLVSKPATGSKRVVLASGKKGKKGKGNRPVVLNIPRSFLSTEIKRYVSTPAFWDAETLDVPTSTASRASMFTNIVQGTASGNRVGVQIRVLEVVFRIYLEQSASITFETVDLAAVLDTEPAAGAPSWTDVFQGAGGGGVTYYHVATANNDNRFRFKYLRRMTIPMEWQTSYWNGAAAVGIVKPVTIELALKLNRQVVYNASTGRPYKGCELDLWGWGDVNANTTKATATVEIFFTDA